MLKAFSNKRLIICAVIIILFIVCAVLITVMTPANTASDLGEEINIYTRNKPNVRLSVSLVTNDTTDIYVFGHDGRKLKNTDTEYELGQLTQVFTGAIAARAVLNGDIKLDQQVGTILPIPGSSYDPTISELVTHTSAYSSFIPDGIGRGSNPYSNFSDFSLLMAMADYTTTSNAPYIYSHSDFGAAVLGTTLGDLYDSTAYTVLNDFVHLDLGLRNTFISTTDDRARHGYPWKVNDAYISSLGLTSTIEDMSSFIKMHLTGDIDYLNAAITPLKEVNEDKDVAFFWNVDKNDGIISYSGHTSHYSACVYLDKAKGNAVIVLSNYPDDKYGSVEKIAECIMENGNG